VRFSRKADTVTAVNVAKALGNTNQSLSGAQFGQRGTGW